MKYVTSRFIDEERENIEVLWEREDGGFITTIVPADETARSYKELMKYADLDTIHDNTWDWINDQKKLIDNELHRIGRERGVIFDAPGGMSSEAFKILLKGLFADFDAVKNKEELFLLKLEIFELDFIQEFKGRKLKARLRKAETVIDAIKTAIEIYETTHEVGLASPDTSD